MGGIGLAISGGDVAFSKLATVFVLPLILTPVCSAFLSYILLAFQLKSLRDERNCVCIPWGRRSFEKQEARHKKLGNKSKSEKDERKIYAAVSVPTHDSFPSIKAFFKTNRKRY